jgi:hypothetical protein
MNTVVQQFSQLEISSRPSSQYPVKTSGKPLPAVPPSPTKSVVTLPLGSDIGSYDGGFEDENQRRGESITGEAADLLRLDSSVSGYVVRQCSDNVVDTHISSRPTREWHLSSFDMGRPLGKGKFGRVYMVRTKCEPKYILALKCLYKSEIVQNKVEKQIRREIEIQQNLRSVGSLHLKSFDFDVYLPTDIRTF